VSLSRAFLLFLFVNCFISKVAIASKVSVDGVTFKSLSAAKHAIRKGSRIYFFTGVFKQGIYLDHDDIEIRGEEGVVFDNAVVDEKAALVLTGNNVLVENIECRNIQVNDKNGACIRFEGSNLTVRNLYAHDSQSGVMTSNNAGIIKIEYSRFERLGGKAKGSGYAHSLYIKADELFFYKSKIISTQGEGSGIKSRSKKVGIDSSLLASMDANDSRLVDMANYGELIIKNSILQQGSNTSNSQLLAYGLETNITSEFEINRVELINNIILFDNNKSNLLISYRLVDEMINKDNIFIGYFSLYLKFIKNNMWYTSRKRAHIPPYPYIPPIDQINSLRLLIDTNGVAENRDLDSLIKPIFRNNE
jgi:hypothetical protein